MPSFCLMKGLRFTVESSVFTSSKQTLLLRCNASLKNICNPLRLEVASSWLPCSEVRIHWVLRSPRFFQQHLSWLQSRSVLLSDSSVGSWVTSMSEVFLGSLFRLAGLPREVWVFPCFSYPLPTVKHGCVPLKYLDISGLSPVGL